MSDAIQIPEAFKPLFQTGWRDLAFYGGRGGAKSHSVAGALVIQAAQSPRRVVCAREIQDSLKDSVKQLIEDKISDYGLEDHFEALKDETRAKNGGRFIYKGLWRNPDAIKSLEGADDLWVEEANRVSARSIRLVRPTMRKPGSRMIWTWNPEFDHDPVDQLFRGPAGPPPQSYVREVSWRDNPWFDATPLRQEMEHDYARDPIMAEHVWGGGYITAIEGAYFAAGLGRAKEDGRISVLAPDPVIRRRAYWDIGVADSTAIWIVQFVGRELWFLDYIEGQGQPLGYYLNELRRRGHDGALCVLPHDGVQRDNLTALSFEDHVKAGGFETRVIKNQGKGAAMMRVEAARRLFDAMWFDEEKCRDGLKALAAYHERRDANRNVGLGPEHDWASHGADAFGLAALDYEAPSVRPDKPLVIPSFGVA